MATLRPSLYPRSSYHSPSPEKGSLQPQWQEARTRSRSRSRNVKPYNPDSPNRYGPNESRSRRPPQSPKVEDGGCGDDGVRMRGRLEQKPMIIDLDNKGEPLPFQPSNESVPITNPGSNLSSESDDSCDDCTSTWSKDTSVNHNSKGIHKGPTQFNGPAPQDASRGRHERPKLDIESLPNEPPSAKLPQLQRARSPYASAPRETRPQEPRRASGGNFLSPTILSAGNHIAGPRSTSQRPPEPTYHIYADRGTGSGSGSGSHKDGTAHDPKGPARPTLERRASAMPLLERTPQKSSPKHHHRSDHHSSSDESGNESACYKAKTAQLSPESKAKVAASYFEKRPSENQRPSEKPRSAQHPSSPPRTPAAAEHPKWGQSLNREALLNVSAALLGTGDVLDNHQRQASPRPSPQASPNHSPYPSPPRTPPEPVGHQYRANPVSSLKHDSPNSSSRPSSPLSSAPSSPKVPDANLMSHHGMHDAKPTRSFHHSDQDVRPSRYMPRSRATSPLPAGRRPELEPPKIDIRSPSPLPIRPAMHSKSPSQEKNEMRTPSRYMPDYASGATLQPTRSDRRPRSASNVDARGQRPINLSINTIAAPLIHQADVEYLSPTSENTPAHFHSSPQHMARPSLLSPTKIDSRSRTSSLAEPTPSTHRSKSSVPAPNAPVPRASSAAPPPTNRHRSRSTAHLSQLALSDQPNPGALPLCPRPDPVSGHNDWYTLEGYDSFAICPDCRNHIFGAGYERYFKLRSSRHHDKKSYCQINDPWIRMACITSINSKHPDLSLLIKLAGVSEYYDPCPGPKPAERDWYRVEDENAAEDDHLADFQVCTHCVHSIEALLPPFKGTFFRYKGHQVDETPRPCSLRFDNARFGQYIDKCEKAAQEAVRSKKEPDMSDFVWYHKKETVIGECTRDQVLIGRDWHLNALIPEFAICEECYYDTVRPMMAKNYNLAKTVSPVAKHISDGVSCQLYSPRMKEIFERACREDDNEYLKEAVMLRRKLQVEILAARMDVQQHPSEWKAQKELDDLMDNWRRLEKKRH